MEEGEQFREPFLLGSRKEKAGQTPWDDKSYAQNPKWKKSFLTSQVNQQFKLIRKLCSYCWEFLLLLGANYSDQCPLSC